MNLLANVLQYLTDHLPLLIIVIVLGVLIVAVAVALIVSLVKRKKSNPEEETSEPEPQSEPEPESEPEPQSEPESEPEPEPEEKPVKKPEEPKPKPAAKPAVPSAIAPVSNQYGGRWIVSESGGMFSFELRANNGETMLRSGTYTSLIGAKNGIDTYKTNIKSGNFRIMRTKSGDYIFQLLSARGTLLAYGEDYKTRSGCENAIESTKRFAASATVELANDEDKK